MGYVTVKNITLRAATADDPAFARGLYLGNMREVTKRLLAWDEAPQTANFDARFVSSEVNIICLDEQDVGWMQIAESGGEVFLKQFFIHPDFQRRSSDTELLQDLLSRAAQAGKTVTLGVVKTNPARSLYERQGFRITSEDQYKVYMEKNP